MSADVPTPEECEGAASDSFKGDGSGTADPVGFSARAASVIAVSRTDSAAVINIIAERLAEPMSGMSSMLID